MGLSSHADGCFFGAATGEPRRSSSNAGEDFSNFEFTHPKFFYKSSAVPRENEDASS